MHWGDDRGQSIQIGAVLLFGALIVALAGYQAFVVPQQNERIEFSHSQTVQNDMQDLRNALASATGDASTRSVSVQLGTRYPARVIAVNPGPPSGSLRTAGTSDSTVAFEVINANATGETGDYWTGMDTRRYPTGALVYQPNYNLYGGAPTTVYEHSALVNDFRPGTVPLAGQAFIEGRQITLVALNGSLDTTRSGTASVDVRPVSASTRTVTVTNRTDSPVRIELPTRFERPVWEELLADQVDNGYVEDFDVVNGSSFNTLVVELTPGENYTLRLAKAGIGTGVGGTDPAYMTRVTANETAVPEEGAQTLVVEVRDAYNNPVSGVNVAGEALLGHLLDGNVTTDGNGRATFRYRAPPVGSETVTAVQFSYPDRSGPFDASSPEDVALGVTIQNTEVDDATVSGGSAPYIVEWQSPPDDRSRNVTADGATISMQALVEDRTLSNKQSVEGASVDFAVNNSTVATLSPGEGVTDGDGEVTTQLTAQANGTVRVYAVSGGASDTRNITFTDMPAAPSVSAVTLANDGSGNLRFSFDTDKQLGTDPADIAVSVDGPNSGVDWQEFDGDDFTETDHGDGTYTYTLATTQAYDDGSGTYTATVDDAVGLDGNNGGENGVGSDLSDIHDYAGNDPTAIQFDNFAGFTADASADEFRLEHVNVQDSDNDDDLDRIEYEVTDSNGNVVATETVSDIGPAQYQAQQPAIVIAGAVQAGETYTITGTVYDEDGNSDSRSLSTTTASPAASQVSSNDDASTFWGNSGMQFSVSNTGGDEVVVTGITVSTDSAPPGILHEMNGGSGPGSREIFVSSSSSSGYYEAGDTGNSEYTLGTAVGLSSTVSVASGDDATITLGFFTEQGSGNSGDRVNMRGRTVDVTIEFSDGSTKTIDPTVPE